MTLWKAYLESRPWGRRRCLHVTRTEPNGDMGVVQTLLIERRDPGKCYPEDSGLLGELSQEETDDFLRAILNVAWEAGLRPTGFQDYINELTAVRYHLEDMRFIAGLKTCNELSNTDMSPVVKFSVPIADLGLGERPTTNKPEPKD